MGRIKPKYNPVPTAKEKAHHLRVMEIPCIGCGGYAGNAHHVLEESPHKRWKRDHRIVVPVCHDCHTQIHHIHGSERKWRPDLDCITAARGHELESIYEGIL
jgi:hypothetical protein